MRGTDAIGKLRCCLKKEAREKHFFIRYSDVIYREYRVDYNQEQFFRMQLEAPKMPFYMTYPMQNLYLTEMEYEKDMDRMKELYPREVKRILEIVEDECDKMEYEGSLMFDEYPDRLMLEQVVDRIYGQLEQQEPDMEAEQYWGGMMPPPPPGRPGTPPPGRPGTPPPRQGHGMRSLIGVLLNNEMYRRRCRHRRCRRWW